MKMPHKIFIAPGLEDYCKKRNIRKQFLKSKDNILQGYTMWWTRLQRRQPLSDKKRYFRINKQYRAIGIFEWDNFLVVYIDDHQ